MSGRHIRVGVRPTPDPTADVNLARVGLRERIMRWLLGPVQEMTLIVPGRKVSDVIVSKVHAENDDLSDEELMALADAVKRHPAGSKLSRAGGDAA